MAYRGPPPQNGPLYRSGVTRETTIQCDSVPNRLSSILEGAAVSKPIRWRLIAGIAMFFYMWYSGWGWILLEGVVGKHLSL